MDSRFRDKDGELDVKVNLKITREIFIVLIWVRGRKTN